MERAAQGFGGGKVILLGEHAVVYGVPGIAAGLQRGVTASARIADVDELRVEPWGRTVEPSATGMDAISRALGAILDEYPERPRLCIDANVSLPPGAGLGCSAAIGVSVIDAVDKALGIARSRESLAARALRWERFFHGSPSGIDNTAAAIGGLFRFEPPGTVQKLESSRSLHLVVMHSGERSSTGEMVARVSRCTREGNHARGWLDRVGSTVERAVDAIRSGDLETLGAMFDRNQRVLRSLGLSTPRIDQLCEVARSAGALGAKLTGAGGGGCMIALAPDAEAAGVIAARAGSDAFVEEVSRAA